MSQCITRGSSLVWLSLLPLFFGHFPLAGEPLSQTLYKARKFTLLLRNTKVMPSVFRGKYLKPEYETLYKDFFRIDPQTHLLIKNGKPYRLLFTIYDQPPPSAKPDETAIVHGTPLSPLQFDYDMLEEDLRRMKEAGINLYLRFFNWSELFNPDGSWKRCTKQPKGSNLPRSHYNYEVYDYFFDRIEAHGLYVFIEPSFYWGLNEEVIPREHWGKILIYDDLWNACLSAYRKLLERYKDRKVIVGVIVGEEDIAFDLCLDDPALQRRFQGFLKGKYRNIEALKRNWRWGYDFSSLDISGWRKVMVKGEEFYYPFYPFKEGVFDNLRSFREVPMPSWEYLRKTSPPYERVEGDDYRTYQENIPYDPIWIDFNLMRQELIIRRVNQLADELRKVLPNHILHYSNPFDFNPSWHLFNVFDRARLKFDVIGVGQHDSGYEVEELPHWARCREYIQNVASYGPYLFASNAHPKAFACGEGEGGRTREGVRKYYAQWMADLIGGGGAYVLSYHWNHISGRWRRGEYDEETLAHFRHFTQSLLNAQFTYKKGKVLILRNTNGIFSMCNGYDVGGTRYLSNILYQLHVPFDILPDNDISLGPERHKVDISQYKFVFVPSLLPLFSEKTWNTLLKWLESSPGKGLCLGYFELLSPYFTPLKREELPRAFARIIGALDLEWTTVEGNLNLKWGEGIAGRSKPHGDLRISFPQGAKVFFLGGGDIKPLLLLNGKIIAGVRWIKNNPVFICGFNLGMAYQPTWGMEKEQEPYDALNPLYETMLESVGIPIPKGIPSNVGFYVSDNGKTLIVKERFGRRTSFEWKGLRIEIGPYETLIKKLN